MWRLDHEEGWASKNRYFWIVVLEMTLESPLDSKEIKPVNPKGNQPWVSLEGLMLKLKLKYFGYVAWRTDSLEKTLMLGKIEERLCVCQERELILYVRVQGGKLQIEWLFTFSKSKAELAPFNSKPSAPFPASIIFRNRRRTIFLLSDIQNMVFSRRFWRLIMVCAW